VRMKDLKNMYQKIKRERLKKITNNYL